MDKEVETTLRNMEMTQEGEYTIRTLARQQKVVGFSGEFCMMYELNEPIDGVEVIPMGYWILPCTEELHTDYDNYGDITINTICEYWGINQVVWFNYDAIIGCVVYEANGGKFGGY